MRSFEGTRKERSSPINRSRWLCRVEKMSGWWYSGVAPVKWNEVSHKVTRICARTGNYANKSCQQHLHTMHTQSQPETQNGSVVFVVVMIVQNKTRRNKTGRLRRGQRGRTWATNRSRAVLPGGQQTSSRWMGDEHSQGPLSLSIQDPCTPILQVLCPG